MNFPRAKRLSKKEAEIVILFHAYSDEGSHQMSVRDISEACAHSRLGDEDDWNWHDYSTQTIGVILRDLEARSLVTSDGRNPALWSLTDLGHSYMDALADKETQAAVLQQGHARYLERLSGTHDHGASRA